MNNGVKWSEESTREFIQLRYRLRHLFNGRKHQCEKAYSRIVDEIGLSNVISATQARKKWSNLLQKYMDIKGGYSTATQDWPYFQILDQIVPLIRKEKIEKLPQSGDAKDIETEEGLPSPLNTAQESKVFRMPGLEDSVEKDKCKTEVEETMEPPRKRGRGRRAAQRARDRWWGAVEDTDMPSEPVKTNSEPPSQTTSKPSSSSSSSSAAVDGFPPSQMEFQTFIMLESCSNSLLEIRDLLKQQVEKQENLMKNVHQAVDNQNSQVKEILNTISTQNATLINLLTKLTKNSDPPLG